MKTDFEQFKNTYQLAIAVASTAHSGQTRKWTGTPYVEHPIAVGYSLHQSRAIVEVVQAGILHDVLEDSNIFDYLYLAKVFGVVVADYVQEVTDVYTPEAFPSCNRAWRKTAEADRLAKVSEGAKMVKLADISDNAKDIEKYDTNGFAKIWLKEKAYLLEKLT